MRGSFHKTCGRTGTCVAAVVLAAQLGSCIHRPQVDQQTYPLPEKFAHQEAVPQQQEAPVEIPAEWWRVFEDETLNRLISTAYTDSPELAQMQARVKQADAQLRFVRGNFFPSITGDASAGRSKRILSDQFQFTTNQISLSLAASYEFNLGGRDFYAYDAAKFDEQAAFF